MSAEKDFLKVIEKVMMDEIEEMTREEELLVLYFMEVLVMLWFLQEPEVVKNMTVSDNDLLYIDLHTYITRRLKIISILEQKLKTNDKCIS